MITRQYSLLLASILLLFFTVLSVGSALRESLTFDEIVHIEEGYNALLKHEFLVDTNNPPLIREIAVIPLVLGAQKFIPSALPNIQILPARLMIIVLGLMLGVALYLVSSKVFGEEVGLLDAGCSPAKSPPLFTDWYRCGC